MSSKRTINNKCNKINKNNRGRIKINTHVERLKNNKKRVTKRKKDDEWDDIKELNNCETIEKSQFVKKTKSNYCPKYQRLSDYNLDYLSRHSNASYSDIFIIIGIPDIHNKIYSLIAVGASCFSQT